MTRNVVVNYLVNESNMFTVMLDLALMAESSTY